MKSSEILSRTGLTPVTLYVVVALFALMPLWLPDDLVSRRQCGLYHDGDLCVGMEMHASFHDRYLNGGNSDGQFADIVIRDDKRKTARIGFDVLMEGLPFVQSVSPKAINIVYSSAPTRFFHYFWVYDRETGEVTAFNADDKRLLTMLPNGKELLAIDDEDLLLMDDYLRVKNKYPFRLESDESVIASSPSPSGQRVAVATWNGQYEEADAVWKVYLLDMNAGDVTLLGESPFLEQLEWAGEVEVSAVSGSIGGKEKVIAKTFTVNP